MQFTSNEKNNAKLNFNNHKRKDTNTSLITVVTNFKYKQCLYFINNGCDQL